MNETDKDTEVLSYLRAQAPLIESQLAALDRGASYGVTMAPTTNGHPGIVVDVPNPASRSEAFAHLCAAERTLSAAGFRCGRIGLRVEVTHPHAFNL